MYSMLKKAMVLFLFVLCATLVSAEEWKISFTASGNPKFDDANVNFKSSGSFTFTTTDYSISGSGDGRTDIDFTAIGCKGSGSSSISYPVSGAYDNGFITLDPFKAKPPTLDIEAKCDFGSYTITVPLVLMEKGQPLELIDGATKNIVYKAGTTDWGIVDTSWTFTMTRLDETVDAAQEKIEDAQVMEDKDDVMEDKGDVMEDKGDDIAEPEKKAAVARITKIKGAVFYVKDGKDVPASRNLNLGEGDIIKTKDGTIVITFVDGSRVQLGPNSEFAIEEQGEKKKFKLNAGFLKAYIKKTFANRFEIRTPFACTCVRGTEFILSHDVASGITTLHLTEGEVDFIPEVGEAQLVTAGNSGTAGASGIIETHATAQEELAQAEDMFDTFDRLGSGFIIGLLAVLVIAAGVGYYYMKKK